jgi:carbonic anhydrase/acetyltransferase-like protein (isoleucine patch superfamily)
VIHLIGEKSPKIGKAVFIAWNAEVAGEVELGPSSSVWFGATVRADLSSIRLGAGSNLQDGTVVHVDSGLPCTIGEEVTVGHGAILHSCTVGNRCVIGMGAILLTGAEVGEESIVGAGALLTQGKTFPPRSLILGSPAKLARELTQDEVDGIRGNAAHYRELAEKAEKEYTQIPI